MPHALGADEFLRMTWHDSRRLAVFSVWSGARCTAAVPVRVGDLGELASLVGEALERRGTVSWPAPDATALVVPASGFELPRPCVA